MSSKYNRHSGVISRHSDSEVDEDSWLHRFEKSLSKDAVQSKKNDASLFDQINTIMNGKSRFPSVDAAVEDMKERSGLTAYLNGLSKSSEDNSTSSKKVASDDQEAFDKEIHMKPMMSGKYTGTSKVDKKNMIPMVLIKHPKINKTIENYIRDTKGNLPVPAIIDKIRSIHSKDVSDAKDWDDDKLIILVSKLNLNAKKNNPGSFQDYSNLGSRDSGSDADIDPSNTDAFFSLNPVKQ